MSELAKTGAPGISLEATNKEYYVLDTNDKAHYEVLMKVAKIGMGNYGDVFSVNALNSSHTKIIKIAKDDKHAKEQLINEYTMLHMLHQSGKLIGIQKAPNAFVNFNKNGVSQTGYLGKLYHGNGFDLSDQGINYEAKIKMTQIILLAKVFLKIKGIYHGDIKPENLLFRVKNGEYELVFADFGGARLLKDILKNKDGTILIPPTGIRHYLGVRTPPYVSDHARAEIINVHQEILQIYSENPIDPKLEEKSKEIGTLLEINDDYATALTLLELLTGKHKFEFPLSLNFLDSKSSPEDILIVEKQIHNELKFIEEKDLDIKNNIVEMLMAPYHTTKIKHSIE